MVSSNQGSAFFTRFDPAGEYCWHDMEHCRPSAAEAVWAYGGKGSQPRKQILVPHWKVCVAVVRRWSPDSGSLEDCRVQLLGPVVESRENANPPGTEIIAVRLNPECAGPVLGIRPEELARMDIVPDRDFRFDALRCLAESTADQAAVGRALLDWVRRHEREASTDCAREAARRIRSSGGRLAIRRLADAVGASERSLRRALRRELGIGAKAYARSVRLKNLLLISDQIAQPDWADLALESGFSDQSHMLREIRTMTGYSASAIHAIRRGKAGPAPSSD